MKFIKVSELQLINSDLIDSDDFMMITDVSEDQNKKSKKVKIDQLLLLFSNYFTNYGKLLDNPFTVNEYNFLDTISILNNTFNIIRGSRSVTINIKSSNAGISEDDKGHINKYLNELNELAGNTELSSELSDYLKDLLNNYDKVPESLIDDTLNQAKDAYEKLKGLVGSDNDEVDDKLSWLGVRRRKGLEEKLNEFLKGRGITPIKDFIKSFNSNKYVDMFIQTMYELNPLGEFYIIFKDVNNIEFNIISDQSLSLNGLIDSLKNINDGTILHFIEYYRSGYNHEYYVERFDTVKLN